MKRTEVNKLSCRIKQFILEEAKKFPEADRKLLYFYFSVEVPHFQKHTSTIHPKEDVARFGNDCGV